MNSTKTLRPAPLKAEVDRYETLPPGYLDEIRQRAKKIFGHKDMPAEEPTWEGKWKNLWFCRDGTTRTPFCSYDSEEAGVPNPIINSKNFNQIMPAPADSTKEAHSLPQEASNQ